MSSSSLELPLADGKSPSLAVADPLEFIAKPTPQLRLAITQFQAQLPPEIFAEMLGTVRTLFEKYRSKLQSLAPGIERATVLHQLMDRELEATSHIPVSCRRGCGGCCHYEVEITADEAAVLRDFVLGGFAIDRGRLQGLSARERRSPAWARFVHPENRCVFLGEDDACQAYAHRPAICRKHLVTTPAEACTTSGAAVAPVQILLAEILVSAQLSLEGQTFGSLPKMLQRALDEAEGRVRPCPEQAA